MHKPIDNKREEIQLNCFQAWLDNNKIGTAEITTGIGKTFIAFRAILSMPKNCNVLFLAETTVN